MLCVLNNYSRDRMPFLTPILNGTPSFIPAYNTLHHNFLISNYGADGDIVVYLMLVD